MTGTRKGFFRSKAIFLKFIQNLRFQVISAILRAKSRPRRKIVTAPLHCAGRPVGGGRRKPPNGRNQRLNLVESRRDRRGISGR
ncbi:hypothetical protein [Brevirhabdus sp.]|uniref:hypothetical protein n=1 Tax=Brevirhabdus sp. TaxID=2004514 RepID=UPI004059909A